MSSAEVLSTYDWAWLLRIPVKSGEPIPLEFWLLYHANTLLPMKRANSQQTATHNG